MYITPNNVESNGTEFSTKDMIRDRVSVLGELLSIFGLLTDHRGWI